LDYLFIEFQSYRASLAMWNCTVFHLPPHTCECTRL